MGDGTGDRGSTFASGAPDGPTVTIDVVAAVIERDGRYLVCQRQAGVQLAGLWEFPGGKVTPGESRPEAMARELEEELGVAMDAYGPERFVYDTADGAYRLHFVSVSVTGEPVALEHAAIRWLAPTEWDGVPLASGDRAFADHVAREAGNRTGFTPRT